jgi:hypothetical protein
MSTPMLERERGSEGRDHPVWKTLLALAVALLFVSIVAAVAPVPGGP